MIKYNEKGIAALPTVVVIAAIVLLAGIGLVETGLVEDALTFGEKESREALYAAEAGIHDGFERLIRDKDCNNGGTPTCASFVLPVGDASASVTIVGATGTRTITASGTRKNKTRKLETVVTIDANNKMTATSWSEIVN